MNERGNLSLLIDNSFFKHEKLNSYIGKENGFNFEVLSSVVADSLNNLTRSIDSSSSIDLIYLTGLINKLSHVNSYDNLVTLLDLAFYKDYIKFCDLFYTPLFSKTLDLNTVYCDNIIETNILNNMLFVCENKQSFINSIRNKGYNVSEGPQS